MRPEDIKTEVFLLPAAAAAEMDGSFTNTQRLVQWHDKAAEPPGDARSDVWFTVHLGRLLKDLYANSTELRDRPIQSLVWDYMREMKNVERGTENEERKATVSIANSSFSVLHSSFPEPSAELILREIHGFTVQNGRPVVGFHELKDDGSTACGAWVYSGIYAPDADHPDGYNHALADAAVQLPGGYADSQIDMVYFSPPLALANGKGIKALTAYQLDGRDWQQWSRHRTGQNPWRPGEDDLSSHMQLVQHWLERERG